jgi:hypothetical protein
VSAFLDLAREVTLAASALVLAASAPAGAETFRVAAQGGEVVVTVGPDAPPVPRAALAGWIENASRAVAAVFGKFPVPEARLDLRTGGRGRIHGGTTDDFAAHVSVAIGRGTTPADLAGDWVLTHEFVHLATPTVSKRHAWFMEGAATYVEPLARARIGLVSADDVWDGLLEGLPKGLPEAGDGGLDVTHTWGRTYWGGALFFLLADVEIRERSGGKRSLDDALRGMLEAGGDVRAGWPLEKALEAGDRAVGGGWNVLSRLHAAQGSSPVSPDLDALFRRLGVSRVGGRVAYDDSAPLASIRRALFARAPQRKAAAARRERGPRTSPGGG